MLYYTLIFDTILYYSLLYYPIPYCTAFVLETGWPPPPHLSSIFKVEGVATLIQNAGLMLTICLPYADLMLALE